MNLNIDENDGPVVRSLLKRGLTIEKIAELSGVDIDTLNIIAQRRAEPKRCVDRSFNKIKCPNCEDVILAGEARFSHAKATRTIINHTYCCHCHTAIEVHVTVNDIKIKLPDEIRPAPPRYTERLRQSLHAGLALTTSIWSNDTTHKLRVGIAILGCVNFKSMIGACPFDPNYHDNFVEGSTVDDLISELESIAQGL